MPGSFASLIVLRFASSAENVSYVNAGHMPPLIVSAAGMHEFEKGNSGSGAFSRPGVHRTHISIPVGATLLLLILMVLRMPRV